MKRIEQQFPSPRIVQAASELRHNMAEAESLLWNHLRSRRCAGLKFRRQHPIGRYILDFYCARVSLAIEVDGPIHQYQLVEDAIRVENLEILGVTVVRYTN